MRRNVAMTGICVIAGIAIFAFSLANAGRTGRATQLVLAPRLPSEPDEDVSKHVDVGGKVAVSYVLASAEVSLHEPVILNFAVENNLSQPVKFDLGWNLKGSFSFTITQPDGEVVELPQLFRMGMSRVGAVQLDADRTYRQSLLLNEWFQFRTMGNYEIQVRLAKPLRMQDGRAISAPTEFRLPLKVGAEDPGHLERVCADLAAQIEAADSYEKAAEAARALGYIEDPVAVPSLEKALASGRMVEQIAIEGLERNGSGEAVEAMLHALNNQPDEVKEGLLYLSLARVKDKVSDPELRLRVEQALQNRP